MGTYVEDLVTVTVVSPVADIVVQALTAVPGNHGLRATAGGVGEHRTVADDEGPTDVVLVSVQWPIETAPFDVMDALAQVKGWSGAPVVLFDGGTVDPEFTNEALGDDQVVGLVPTDTPPDELADVLAVTARDGSHPSMSSVVASSPTLADELEGNRLMASVACAVAIHGATTWADIARLSGFSIRTVETSPRRFGPLVRADLGLDADQDVTQPLLYHWLGTKSAYLRSWCRRRHSTLGR